MVKFCQIYVKLAALLLILNVLYVMFLLYLICFVGILLL